MQFECSTFQDTFQMYGAYCFSQQDVHLLIYYPHLLRLLVKQNTLGCGERPHFVVNSEIGFFCLFITTITLCQVCLLDHCFHCVETAEFPLMNLGLVLLQFTAISATVDCHSLL